MILAVLLLSSGAAFAQEKPTAIYVFVTNPSYAHSDLSGDRFDGAFGIALQRMFTPRFSGELSVSRRSDFSSYTTLNPDGTVLESHSFTGYSMPVDLTVRYHFLTQGAWKPYAGIGVRYASRAFGDVTGGVVWQFHRSLGLRLDAKVLVGSRTRFDDQVNTSAGLAWRF
jgi:outer membrane protein W